MAFFTVKADAESVRDGGNGSSSYINKSGMYEVIIKHVVVDQTKNGSQVLHLWLEYAGKEQPIYNAIRLTNNDGTANFGQDLFNKLCVVMGAANGGEISDPIPAQVPMGKGGEMKTVDILPDFEDQPVHMHVRMEYSLYNDSIQEAKTIRNFFRYEDKATAAEIVNNSNEKGKQYEKEAESVQDSYKNGLTKEDVDAWLTERRNGKKEEPKDVKPSVGFGAKRTFGRKV